MQHFDGDPERQRPAAGAIGGPAQAAPRPGDDYRQAVRSDSWADTQLPVPNGEVDRPTALETVVAVLRRRFLWVVQAVVIICVVVGVLTHFQHKQYTATASLLFQDQSGSLLGNGANANPSFQAATDASLVGLPVIAVRAAVIAGAGYTADEVGTDVTVTPSSNGDVVEIAAKSTVPARAATIANAYGQAYIAFRESLDRGQIQNAINSLQGNLNALPPAAQAGAEGTSLRSQLGTLQLAYALVAADAALVQRASPPSSPSSPRLTRNLILALIIGLIVGVALAFARERFDQRVRTPEELEHMFGIPLLARIPFLRARGWRHLRRLWRRSGTSLDPQAAEAFRTLRANLRYFGGGGPLRSILVTSPMRNDGKSTVAKQLAVTMAVMGDNVVLVEADMHDQGRRTRSGETTVGLSSVLTGARLDEALRPLTVAHGTNGQPPRQLVVLPSGPQPANPSELLDSKQMLALLDELGRRFDVVVIDSPALTRLSDGRGLVGRVTEVVIVGRMNHTQRRAAREFREQIILLGGNVAGIIANHVPLSRKRDYEYAA